MLTYGIIPKTYLPKYLNTGSWVTWKNPFSISMIERRSFKEILKHLETSWGSPGHGNIGKLAGHSWHATDVSIFLKVPS